LPLVEHNFIVFTFSHHQYKHKDTRTSLQSKCGAGTPKNPKVILSSCEKYFGDQTRLCNHWYVTVIYNQIFKTKEEKSNWYAKQQ